MREIPGMHEYIISDTSCIILFEKIQALRLLYEVYGTITVTPEIALEYKLMLPQWVKWFK